ncbi:MAG: PKD domain-containing protein [Bacteroidota bacterium]
MKRLLTILSVLSLLVTSCYKEPFADFRVSPQTAFVDEEIAFTNLSENAAHVEWDMDDGTITSVFSPSYAYELPGLYNVMLSAFGEKGDVSVAYFTVEVVGDLKIIVKEYYDEYVVPNARVRLYPTLYDWENETNLAAESYTNSDGECVFAYLDYQRYYVDVFETWHDNYTLAGEEGGVQWIETPLLNPDLFYIFTAYVDVYDTPASKAATTTKTKKMMMKEEVSDAARPAKTTSVSKPRKTN